MRDRRDRNRDRMKWIEQYSKMETIRESERGEDRRKRKEREEERKKGRESEGEG